VFGTNTVTLRVKDDGIGFADSDVADPKAGFGVAAMRERVREMHGTIEFGAIQTGGTQINVMVPTRAEV
jgi:signal transduction histidine kinase